MLSESSSGDDKEALIFQPGNREITFYSTPFVQALRVKTDIWYQQLLLLPGRFRCFQAIPFVVETQLLTV